MSNEVVCPVIQLEGGIMPDYKTKKAACADCAVPVDVVLEPGKCTLVGLKLAFEIPDDMKIVMYPRSSLLVKRGIMQPTSIIEPDYNGQEVHAPLFNTTSEPILIKAGERVCQIECVPRYDCKSWDHDDVERDTQNGGFGSTGK